MQYQSETYDASTAREREGLEIIGEPFRNANSYFNVNEFERAREFTDKTLKIRRTYQLRQYAGILQLDAKLTEMGFPSQDQYSIPEGKES